MKAVPHQHGHELLYAHEQAYSQSKGKKESRVNDTGQTGRDTVSMVWRVHNNSAWDRSRVSFMRGVRTVHDRTTH